MAENKALAERTASEVAAETEVAAEMAGLIPGLTVSLSNGPGGAGHTYLLRGKRVGTLRSRNGSNWRIDGDAAGYPFGSEREATMELLRRKTAAGPTA